MCGMTTILVREAIGVRDQRTTDLCSDHSVARESRFHGIQHINNVELKRAKERHQRG